jgi:hypothetical protein
VSGASDLVKTIGIFSHTLTIGDSDDDGIGSEVTEEDLNEIAGDISIGAACDLDSEGLSAGVDVERFAERDIKIDHHTLAGDTELLVVESSTYGYRR